MGTLACVPRTPTAVGPARGHYLQVDGGKIFFEVVGSGAPIIVVHGGPGLDHRYLRPGLDILAADHTLIYYDQRGTGQSDVIVDSTHITLARFVEDLDDLRSALGYRQVTVLGHSFGGLLALAYARAHPDETQALVLMDSAEPGRRFEEETLRRQLASRTVSDSLELAHAMAEPGFLSRDPATLSRVYRASFRGTMRFPERVSELDLDLAPRTAKNGQDVARFLGSSMLSHWDTWDELKEVKAPTLVLQGRWDAPPLAMGEALAGAVANGHFVALQSGHFPYVEDPSGLEDAVSTFLGSIEQSSQPQEKRPWSWTRQRPGVPLRGYRGSTNGYPFETHHLLSRSLAATTTPRGRRIQRPAY